MKYLIFIILLPYSSYAQKMLTIQYSDFEITSRNLGVTYGQQKGKHTYYIGTKFHFNDEIEWANNIYYRNLYSENFLAHFGLIGGYERILTKLKSKSRFRFVAFYDAQFTINSIRDRRQIYDFNTNTSYPIVTIFGPVTFLENNIGFGSYFKLSNNYQVNLKIGGGVCGIWRPGNKYPRQFWGTNGDLTYEFTRLLSAGITYKFDNPTSSKKHKTQKN